MGMIRAVFLSVSRRDDVSLRARKTVFPCFSTNRKMSLAPILEVKKWHVNGSEITGTMTMLVIITKNRSQSRVRVQKSPVLAMLSQS